MKRAPKLTKKERKAQQAQNATRDPRQDHPHDHDYDHDHDHDHDNAHIHCIACGRHLDDEEFDPPASAMVIKCDHGSYFPSCTGCEAQSRALIAEHDRTGKPVQTHAAWH